MNNISANLGILEKKDLDWASLKFEYHNCKFRFQATYENGKWDSGSIIEDNFLHLDEASTAIHYSQQCFEGLKAYTAKDGRILLFRPLLNYQRMQETSARLMMPKLPEELFFKAVREVVLKNYDSIPPYGYAASLYIRPLLIGVGQGIGIRTSDKYIFRVFVSPVGPYYEGGKIKPLTLAISEEDRAAPRGIGHVKAGSNYIAGISLKKEAAKIGADELLYLDPIEHKYLEESGAANLLVYFKDKTFSTPKASTILPSITRKSAMQIAKDILNLKTLERRIAFYEEAENIEEFASCGTAAAITPIGTVIDCDKNRYHFYDQGKSVGPITEKLYEILTGIQQGTINDAYGWTYEVK